ncbi:DNA primase, partial [Bacillus altitudinis]
RWQIGFAPDDFHTLEQALAKKKVGAADLVKAGVSAKNERGQMYDRFRSRITFPIFDYNGQCAGFSARILNDDGKSAKYVNS